MTKVTGFLSAVIRRLIFIGFTVQIVFGLIWIMKNIGYLQLFGDTAFYVTVSGTLKCDEYTGVLYPVLLLLVRSAGTVCPIPWYSLMYLFQLAIAFVSVFSLLKESDLFGGKVWKYVWGSLAVMTCVPLMQVNLAILPNSVTCSLLILEAAFFIKVLRQIKKADGTEKHVTEITVGISGVCLFWLLAAINEPVNFIIGIVPVIASFITLCNGMRGRRRKFFWIRPIAVILVFAGLIAGINGLTQEKGYYGRVEITAEKILVNRFAWKSRFLRSGSWLTEITDVVGKSIMQETSENQENVWLLVEPELEEKLGEDGASDIYRYLISVCMDIDKKEILHDMAIDTAAYCIPQVFIELFLRPDSYITYTPRNYDVFKRNTPLLAKYYWDYSLILFIVSFILTVILFLFTVIDKIVSKEDGIKKYAGYNKKTYVSIFIVSMVMIFIQAVIYMMRGSGVYDYKSVSSTTSIWTVLLLEVCIFNKKEEKT